MQILLSSLRRSASGKRAIEMGRQAPFITSLGLSLRIGNESPGPSCRPTVAPLGGSSRALFRRDRLDDDSTRLPWIERFARPFQGLPHEGPNCGQIQILGLIQDNVADRLPAPLQQVPRIGQTGSMEEEETDPPRIHRDGEEGVGGAVRRTESDDQGVVVVIDEFEGSGQDGSHLRQDGSGPGRDLRCELGDETAQLFFRR